MQKLKTLISKEDLSKRVSELAKEISAKENIDIIVGVLTGSFIFVADLMRAMPKKELCVKFVKASSYGEGTVHGDLHVSGLDHLDVLGKNILVVDDILDSGHTLCTLAKAIREKGAANVKTCALLDKPSRREVPFQADYVGFKIENLFVVGYGLDYANEYRSLPEISVLEESK